MSTELSIEKSTEKRIEVRVAVNGIVALDNSVLLTRRSPHIREPGKWCIPGGHVETGEVWFSALCRELNEEVGIVVKKAEVLGVYSDPKLTLTEEPILNDSSGPVFGHFVVVTFVVSDFTGEITLSDEVDAWDWFKEGQLPAEIIRSHPIRLEDFWNKRRGVIR